MSQRSYHIAAISTLVAGIAVGAISWVVNGDTFWIVVGISLALVLIGVVLAGKASPGRRPGPPPDAGGSPAAGTRNRPKK